MTNSGEFLSALAYISMILIFGLMLMAVGLDTETSGLPTVGALIAGFGFLAVIAAAMDWLEQ